MAHYRIRTGLNHDDHRHEAGERVDCLPEESLGWLVEQGHVVAVEELKPARGAPKAEEA